MCLVNNLDSGVASAESEATVNLDGPPTTAAEDAPSGEDPAGPGAIPFSAKPAAGPEGITRPHATPASTSPVGPVSTSPAVTTPAVGHSAATPAGERARSQDRTAKPAGRRRHFRPSAARRGPRTGAARQAVAAAAAGASLTIVAERPDVSGADGRGDAINFLASVDWDVGDADNGGGAAATFFVR